MICKRNRSISVICSNMNKYLENVRCVVEINLLFLINILNNWLLKVSEIMTIKKYGF